MYLLFFYLQITRSLRATVMIVLAYGIGLPVSLMRDISSLASLSALSLFFYTSFVTQVILKKTLHRREISFYACM